MWSSRAAVNGLCAPWPSLAVSPGPVA